MNGRAWSGFSWAASHVNAIIIMMAWLTENCDPNVPGIDIMQVDVHQVAPDRQRELRELLVANLSGMVSGGPETGWTLNSISEAPYP